MAPHKVSLDFQQTHERQDAWDTLVNSDASEVVDLAAGVFHQGFKITQPGDVHQIARALGRRGKSESSRFQNTAQSTPTARGNIVANYSNLIRMLPYLFQKSADWPFTADGSIQSLYPCEYAELPDMKGSGEGYFATLTDRSPDASDSDRMGNSLINGGKFMIHHTDNDGILAVETEWIGQSHAIGSIGDGEIDTNLILSSAADPLFEWDDIVDVDFGGVDLTDYFLGAEFNVTSGAKFLQDAPNGEVIFPEWIVDGNIVIGDNAAIEAMRGKVRSRGTSVAELLTISFGSAATPAALGDLRLSTFCYLTSDDDEADEGKIWTFGIEGLFGGAGEYPFEVEIFIPA